MRKLKKPNYNKLFADLDDNVAKLQKICDFLRNNIKHYDWVGFYMVRPGKNELELGPFSGEATDHKVIPFGKGVCGQSATREEMIVVPDVTELDNYLACSLYVKAEIVVPVFKQGKYIAQLDIDSHQLDPFTKEDENYLKDIISQLTYLFPIRDYKSEI
ncbi:MAG: GAF domain-containing protein [Candidatus Marinimicrobia bacterium]|nr:GAF domain-containing protein [Candidatus Neomarinimicrobiota bacterium]